MVEIQISFGTLYDMHKLDSHKIEYFTPDWRVISRIFNVKFFSRIYVWILVVPMIAWFIKDFPEFIYIKIAENELKIEFSLPFNWFLMYLGGVLFLFCQIVFIMFCPVFIREYRSAGDAIDKGVTAQKIREMSINYLRLRRSFTKREGHLLKKFVHDWDVNLDDHFDESNIPRFKGAYVVDALSKARLIVEPEKPGFYRFSGWSDRKLSIDREQFIKLSFQRLDLFLKNTGFYFRLTICFFLFLSAFLVSIPFFEGFYRVFSAL